VLGVAAPAEPVKSGLRLFGRPVVARG